MYLPLCVSPHNPAGFWALAKLVEAFVPGVMPGALAVAVVPTVFDESGPFVFTDVPGWTRNGDAEAFSKLVRQSEIEQFLTILGQHTTLPIRASPRREIRELVSSVGNFGASASRPYWVVVLIGPKSESIHAFLGHSVADIDAEELQSIMDRLLNQWQEHLSHLCPAE